MPKAIKKKDLRREAKRTPGYYCPECTLLVPNAQQAHRPPIWHEECKPPIGDPRRKKRICPGCTKPHTIGFGESSSYHNQACKMMYVAFQDDKQHKEVYPCFCGKPAVKGKKKGRRYALCDKHEFQVSTILTFRDVHFNAIFNTWDAIEYAKNDLADLPDKYKNALFAAERSLPREQKTW